MQLLSPFRSIPRPALALTVLAIAGLAGNHIHSHLLFGTDFVFGSIAVLVALRLFGTAWGTLIAAIMAVYALNEWWDPYAAVMPVLEALLVGRTLAGQRKNIVLFDGTFWLLLGMPLIWAAQYKLLHSDVSVATYLALKQGFNGIFNATAASLILDFLPVSRWVRGAVAEKEKIPLHRLVFNLLLASIVFPAFALLSLSGGDEAKKIDAGVQRQLDDFATGIAGQLAIWQQRRSYVVARLAEIAARPGGSSGSLQHDVELAKQLFPDLDAVYIGNAAGAVTAGSHYAAGGGKQSLDVSDNPWFGELKRTVRPVVSDVFVVKSTGMPAVSIGVPVVSSPGSGEHGFQGFAAALLSLGDLGRILAVHAREAGVQTTLFDSRRRVIASSREELKPMDELPVPRSEANTGRILQEMEEEAGLPFSRAAFSYVRELPLKGGTSWSLRVEIPTQSYRGSLIQRLINNLGIAWALVILASLIGTLVSRLLTIPLARLADATADLDLRLAERQEIRLTESSIREIDSLVGNFQHMVRALRGSYLALNRTKETLEQRVKGRTELLSEANEKLERHLTERKRIEEALAQHTRKLEKTMAELERQKFALDQHAIVSITDREGRIVYANDKLCEISQYSREELLGRNHRIMNSGYHPKAFFEEMWQVIGSGRVWQGEIRNLGRNGNIFWLDTTIVPFMDATGKPYQYVSIRTDITERKLAEIALTEAKEAAEKANRAKSEFLSHMSHELRTPLNAILGFAQLLETDSDEPLTPSQHENTRHILEAGWHLLELVNEVLDLARIEAGRMALAIGNVDLGAVLEESLGLIAPLAGKRGIEIIKSGSCSCYFIAGDKIRLKQVVVNLLSNAVKYNRDHGSITVDCREMPGGLVRLSVRDTGLGIPAEKMAQLFQPFSRLDADKTEIQGAGAGLAISKRLTELMGGTIGVDSVPGEGSTFWIELRQSEREGEAESGNPE